MNYSSVLESIVNMDNNDIAEEGLGNVLKNLKDRILSAIDKFVEWIKRQVTRLKSIGASSKLAAAGKQDGAVGMIAKTVDQMLACVMNVYQIAKKQQKIKPEGNESGNLAGDNIAGLQEKFNQICEKIDSLCKGLGSEQVQATLGKRGVNMAVSAFNSWEGKLTLLKRSAQSFADNDAKANNDQQIHNAAFGVRGRNGGSTCLSMISTAISTMQKAGNALVRACPKLQEEQQKKDDDFVNSVMRDRAKEQDRNNKNLEKGRADWARNEEKEQKRAAREDRKKEKAAQRNAKKAAAAAESAVPGDTNSLQFAVESMLAAIDYATKGYYVPTDEIGEAVEASITLIQTEMFEEELDLAM